MKISYGSAAQQKERRAKDTIHIQIQIQTFFEPNIDNQSDGDDKYTKPHFRDVLALENGNEDTIFSGMARQDAGYSEKSEIAETKILKVER